MLSLLIIGEQISLLNNGKKDTDSRLNNDTCNEKECFLFLSFVSARTTQ